MWQSIIHWITTPSNQVVLVVVLVAFIIGLLIGLALRIGKGGGEGSESHSKEGDRAFIKGVQYILSNDHDQAIEQFTKAVQVDSETIETYVALGNLYRSKGDIDRAIRIRQNIILRPNINEKQRTRAKFDIGLDYKKGGFLDRALEAFSDVLHKEPSNLPALEEVEKIYEEVRDWENAFFTRQKISRILKENHSNILAHHRTEEGKDRLEKGDIAKAKQCFKKAISIDPACVDAYLHLGDLYQRKEDYKKAVATWKRIADAAPAFIYLAYDRLEGAYSQMRNLKPVEDFLKECAEKNADAFTRLALAKYLYNRGDANGALKELEQALDSEPKFFDARVLMGRILLEKKKEDRALEAYGDLIAHLNVSTLAYQCTNCGYHPAELQWQCPQCRHWDTIKRMEPRENLDSAEKGLEIAPISPEGGNRETS
jgi:lipopolysaccharide biosynthesis regulator YciM